MNADGSAKQNLTDDPASAAAGFGKGGVRPAWSPAGTAIVRFAC